MIKSILSWSLNTIHILFICIPFILIFISRTLLRKHSLMIKIITLLILLTPLHWRFLKNQCSLTLLSIKLGNDNYNANTDAPFTRGNMGPIYKPIMALFGLKWENDEHLDLVINVHWVINYFIAWYILAFKLCKN
jgi:hypothetical protein